MEKRIFKYHLAVTDFQQIEMPEDAEILSLQIQKGKLCLWALIDIDKVLKYREFRMFGTGHLIPNDENLKYIGTFQLFDGGLMFHCFEIIN